MSKNHIKDHHKINAKLTLKNFCRSVMSAISGSTLQKNSSSIMFSIAKCKLSLVVRVHSHAYINKKMHMCIRTCILSHRYTYTHI